MFRKEPNVFIFSDNVAGDWPVVLVSNPKQSKFLAPAVEPVQKIRESKEIRILAFSPFGVSSVQVRINKSNWKKCSKHNSVSDLYVLPWNPKELISVSKKHFLEVSVQDSGGNQKTIQFEFQLDFDQILDEYSLYARMILMSDVQSILQFVWFMSILISMLPVYLGRLCNNHLCFYTFKSVARYKYVQ